MTDYPPTLNVRPLTTWPGDPTPTAERRCSPFSAPLRNTLDLLDRELWHLDAEHPVLEVAIPAEAAYWRQDGRPRANAPATHPGIVLSLPRTNAGPLRYATDLFTTWQENLRAIALGLEALRKVERYGIVRRGEQYVGFAALPAPGEEMTRVEAIGVIFHAAALPIDPEQLQRDPELLRRAVRAARGNAHPDRHHGDRTSWNLVEAALTVLGRTP